jgi:hypothetical protein
MLEESSQQGLEAELLELIKFTKSYAFLYAKLNVEFFTSRIYEQIDTEVSFLLGGRFIDYLF